ncbi:MAG: hypothetical protein GX786_10815 [Clostridiales bacterium]|nr:hypothetical protein [Clostridiales bacterium]
MTKEQLLAINPDLTDDQITQILAGIEATTPPPTPPAGSIPYERFKAVNDNKKTLEAQVASMQTMLKDLTGEGEDLDKQRSALQALVANSKKELTEYKKGVQLEKLITQAGARNFKTVLPLLDEEALTYDEEKDTFPHLEEKLAKAKEENAYLFQGEKEKEPPAFYGSPNPAPPPKDTKEAKAMTYMERLELKQKNPKEYDRLFKGE